MAIMTPAEEARCAIDFGTPRTSLSIAKAGAAYDRLLTEGYKPGDGPSSYTGDGPSPYEQDFPYDSLVGITTRTPPEVRERILAMFKNANSKYPKPFDKDRLAWASLFGGNWEEYGQIVLQMAILDTLLSIEEKLGKLAGSD